MFGMCRVYKVRFRVQGSGFRVELKNFCLRGLYSVQILHPKPIGSKMEVFTGFWGSFRSTLP